MKEFESTILGHLGYKPDKKWMAEKDKKNEQKEMDKGQLKVM